MSTVSRAYKDIKNYTTADKSLPDVNKCFDYSMYKINKPRRRIVKYILGGEVYE